MKNFKKIVTLCTALLLTLGLAGACAPTDTDSPENSESQSVSAPESSVPETDESSCVSTPEEPEQPEEPESIQYEEVGYFTKNVLRDVFSTCSHELDAGLYYVTSYDDFTVFTEYSAGVFAELTESGTVEFDVTCNNWEIPEDEEIEIDYYIYKIIPFEMNETEANATFLTDGAITPITVTLAEAGVYSFTVNQDVIFYSSMNAYESLVYQSYYTLFTDQANTEITLYIGGLESAYGDVELTLGLEKVIPEDVTEETQNLSLRLPGDNAFAFTAEENGAYRIDFDENLSVAVFNSATNFIDYAYDSTYFEFDYTGEPVVFFARYAGIEEELLLPYGASVTITRIGDEGYRSPVAPEDIYVNSAGSVSSFIPANSVEQNIPLTVIISATGEWSISWDNHNVKVYVGETLIESGYEFSVEDRYGALQLTVHNEMKVEQSVTFTLTEKSSAGSGNTLTLGANAITVTVTDFYASQTECSFTAEKAGKYRLSTADGEENADVYDANNEWIEVLPYEFVLRANERTSFFVASIDVMFVTVDEINLIIEYYDEATQTWVQE